MFSRISATIVLTALFLPPTSWAAASEEYSHRLPSGASSESCESCHEGIGAGQHIHTALDEFECDECHNPHATPPVSTASCAECHDDMLTEPVLHPPAEEDCIECHSPHSGQYVNQLLVPVPELCLQCHDEKEEGKHGRVQVGVGCIECHNPHSSDREGLLEDLGDRSCDGCHPGKTDGRYLHSALKTRDCQDCHDPHAVLPKPPPECISCHGSLIDRSPAHGSMADDQCVECHDPHSADQPKQMINRETGSSKDCVGCHSMVKRKLEYAPVRHEPVAEGDCTDCHTNHSGEKPFTVDSFRTSISGPYDAAEFELCFGCHSTSLVQSRTTGLGTGFRRASLNLHHVHVIRDGVKGYSCKVCHDVHASEQQHLINREVPYNARYSLKIIYRATDKGGSCETNCHVPREYIR